MVCGNVNSEGVKGTAALVSKGQGIANIVSRLDIRNAWPVTTMKLSASRWREKKERETMFSTDLDLVVNGVYSGPKIVSFT